MAAAINADDGVVSGSAGLKSSADATGVLVLQTNGTTALTVDTSQRTSFVAGTAALPAITTTGDTNTGIFFPAADTIAFAEGGAEAMRINSSGQLGIGQTSPAYLLDVNGTMRLGSAGSIQPLLSRSSSEGGLLVNTTAGGGAAFIVQNNGTEQARIDSSGNLLVGTTTQLNSANARICPLASGTSTQAINAVAPSSYTGVVINSQSVTTASLNWFYFAGQSGNGTSITTNSVLIYGNGNVANVNNSYGAISDIKLKENIVDATPKLDKLMQVRVVNYNLKADLGYQSHKQIGVVAQELEAVFPAMVEETTDKDMDGNELGTTTKSVKYSVFVPMLVKAIQEQQAIIESLKARLDAANL